MISRGRSRTAPEVLLRSTVVEPASWLPRWLEKRRGTCDRQDLTIRDSNQLQPTAYSRYHEPFGVRGPRERRVEEVRDERSERCAVRPHDLDAPSFRSEEGDPFPAR